jgi:dnd system-associated protein 4
MAKTSRERPSGGGQRRLNRPKDKDDLLQRLVDQGPFRELRDVLVFAAALGWHEQRRIPLASRGEPIRWEVATNRRGTEALVNMIAASASGDPEILSDDRFDDRLAIFEEYANGGLELLGALLAAEPRPTVDIVLELVQKVLRADQAEEPVNLSEVADELKW